VGNLAKAKQNHRTTEAAVRKSEANEVETPHRVETGLEDVWHGMRAKRLAGVEGVVHGDQLDAEHACAGR